MALNPWWSGWSDFGAMGGYGLYVWGSFGVCAGVVASELAALRARRAGLRRGAAIDDTTDNTHDDDVNLEPGP